MQQLLYLRKASAIGGGSSSKLGNSKASFQPPHAPPPAINDFNACYTLLPPANIASPSFGSDVAARYARATLRAAVVHIPLFALKMSTVLAGLLAPAQGISIQRRQQMRTTKLASMISPPPHTTPPAINNFNTCYALWPPANIAIPSFGSDGAARQHRATLSDDAFAHVPKGAEFTCCAAAMATKMQPVKSRARLLMRKM